MVDWLFLPPNFGPVVGTYKDLLWRCECTLGDGSIFRWWGHHVLIKLFLAAGGVDPKT